MSFTYCKKIKKIFSPYVRWSPVYVKWVGTYNVLGIKQSAIIETDSPNNEDAIKKHNEMLIRLIPKR